MKARAALLWEQPGQWLVEDVELNEPGFGEVLVEMVATGLCNSDDHIAVGDAPVPHHPFCGGHEGSGIIRSSRARGPHICHYRLEDINDAYADMHAGCNIRGVVDFAH
ncbi:alcohol dehydrogenase catalytic domain-containing protein [Streptomyces sp. NPDC055186]